MMEEEVPTSHHNFVYESSLNVEISHFHSKLEKSKNIAKIPRFMKNVIPTFRYNPFGMIEEEVPASHHNFVYESSLNVKI